MDLSGVFTALVEPNLDRIPVLEVSHKECHHGRDYFIAQIVLRNVFTDFDKKLSRHLAATRGAGFPAFTVSVEISECGRGGPARRLEPSHHASVPHALKRIAERAFARDGRAELNVHHNDPSGGDRGAGAKRVVSADDIEALDAGLQICRFLGEAEFLTISGDFDIVMAGPPGPLKPIIMNLRNGSIAMPCTNGGAITPFECPIHGFARHAGENVLAQGYLAQARHALVAAKEDAVADFRAMAETRILSFDRALAGRPLVGHRLDAATGLVERLKVGLGTGLNGLSEDAQITALDWSAEIADGDPGPMESPPVATGGGRPPSTQHMTVAHAAPRGI